MGYSAPSSRASEIAISRGFFRGLGKVWPSAHNEGRPSYTPGQSHYYLPHAKGPRAYLCGRCGGVCRRGLHRLCTWDHQGGGPVPCQSPSRSGQPSHSSSAVAGTCNLGGLSCVGHGASRPPPRKDASRFHSASCREHSRARMSPELQGCQGPRQHQHTHYCGSWPGVRQQEHTIGCWRGQGTLQRVACPHAEHPGTRRAEPTRPVW